MKSRLLIAITMVPLMLASAPLGASKAETRERLEAAATAFQEIMATPDKGIPEDLLRKASCAVLVPGMKKGAFIVGAHYGRGFLLCRKDDGGWSSPAGVKIEGGSVGFQIGGSETDVFMLVMNDRGIDKLLSNKFTLGGDAAVAAGPVGRQSRADTDAAMRAEILSWSRSRGVFAGVSLQGASLREDDEANTDMYDRPLKNREVIFGTVAPPSGAEKLEALLGRYK
jgi:lipid-binding SYLF domain-containing protein